MPPSTPQPGLIASLSSTIRHLPQLALAASGLDNFVTIETAIGRHHVCRLGHILPADGNNPYQIGNCLSAEELKHFDQRQYHKLVAEKIGSNPSLTSSFYFYWMVPGYIGSNPAVSEFIDFLNKQRSISLLQQEQISTGISTYQRVSTNNSINNPSPSLFNTEDSENGKSNWTPQQALATGVLSTGNPVQQPNYLSTAEVIGRHSHKKDEPPAPQPFSWIPIDKSKPISKEDSELNTDKNKAENHGSTDAKSSRAGEKKSSTVVYSSLDSSSDDGSDLDGRGVDLYSQFPIPPTGTGQHSKFAGKRFTTIPFTKSGKLVSESKDDSNSLDSSAISARGIGKKGAVTYDSDTKMKDDTVSTSTGAITGNSVYLDLELAESSSRAGSRKPFKGKNRSKSNGGRKFNEHAALHEAGSSNADTVRGALHSNGDIDGDYLFDPDIPLHELSYANLEEATVLVDPRTEWRRDPAPYWVQMIHCDTSRSGQVVPGGVKHFQTIEQFIGPIDSRQEANDVTIASMVHRNQELYEAYYPGMTLREAQFVQHLDEDTMCYELSVIHDQFYLIVRTVLEAPGEDKLVMRHDFSRQEKTRYIVSTCISGPVHNQVIPYGNPEISVEICSSINNASKWAACVFKLHSRHLLCEQEIQQCILKIMKIAEQAEKRAAEQLTYPEHFAWNFSHVFDSIHELPGGKGAGLKTKIHISVRSGRSDRT